MTTYPFVICRLVHNPFIHTSKSSMIKKGLCGAILTQLSDVEDETNGLVTYDRMVVKADREEMQKIAADIKVLSSEG